MYARSPREIGLMPRSSCSAHLRRKTPFERHNSFPVTCPLCNYRPLNTGETYSEMIGSQNKLASDVTALEILETARCRFLSTISSRTNLKFHVLNDYFELY